MTTTTLPVTIRPVVVPAPTAPGGAARTSSLPATWSNDAWREAAACKTLGNELFFPTSITDEATPQIELAKAVCTSCPVREACLEFALRTAQDDGIWGGHTEEERRSMRRARRVAARRQALQAS
jgi:WhiB family redox-sensing transcriptional regulator